MNPLRAVGLTALLISAGCSAGVRSVEHEIRYESSLNSVTEEILVEYTLGPITGRSTAPVIRAIDPSGIDLDSNLFAPFSVFELSVSDGELAIVQDSVVSVFNLPAPGEILTLRQQADSVILPSVSGFLEGQVQSQSITVDVPVRRGLWAEIRLTIKWLLVLAGAGIVGFVIYLIYQRKRARAFITGTSQIASKTLSALIGKLDR